MKKIISVLLIAFSASIFAKPKQNIEIQRVEPMNWWVNMECQPQLLVYGENIGNASVQILDEGIQITKVTKAESKNYLFIDIRIAKNAKAGNYRFEFSIDKQKIVYEYSLLKRKNASAQRKSFDQSDLIYLLMPDRFSNGDKNNDNTTNTIEKAERKIACGRHGGDIQGIINHLDYISELGATAIWSTPLTLDNEKDYSYHGYACSDYYQIDPRYGSNELFKHLVEKAHEKGLKIIMDMVPNHCGTAHWWMKDLPFNDWIHQFPEFTRSSFRMETQSDPHTSQYDLKNCIDGWFDVTMPDMNLSHPFVIKYLAQTAIWWIEYADLDGLRVDTYPYSDKIGITEWIQTIFKEYPHFNITGETWFHNVPMIAYWQKDARNPDGFNSNLPVPMDFNLQENIIWALNDEHQGWDNGFVKVYNILAQDFTYENPYNLLIFLENHDVARLSEFLNNNLQKVKLAYSILATMRGIPQIYMGSELFMKNPLRPHDCDRRMDMVGGWEDDARDAFTNAGRTAEERELFDYLKNIFQWRKTSQAVKEGKLLQFFPIDNHFYFYFRITDNQIVMTCINNGKEARNIDWSRCEEVLKNVKNTVGRDIISNSKIKVGDLFALPAGQAMIIEWIF